MQFTKQHEAGEEPRTKNCLETTGVCSGGAGASHNTKHRNCLCVPLLFTVAKYLEETVSEKRGLFLADG